MRTIFILIGAAVVAYFIIKGIRAYRAEQAQIREGKQQ